MRVRECEKCFYYRRRTWSTYYIPKKYHPIGMTHAYGWCLRFKRRVLDVRKCEDGFAIKGQLPIEDA